MHTLTYEVSGASDGIDVFRAIIDGKRTFFNIDVAALEISRSEGGVCPILFCDRCGMIGCAGYYAFTETDDNEIVWSYFYERFYKPESPEKYKTLIATLHSNYSSDGTDFKVSAPLRFDKAEYNTLVEKLITELEKFPLEEERYLDHLASYRSGNRFRG